MAQLRRDRGAILVILLASVALLAGAIVGLLSIENARALREAAKVTPLDAMLVETDAPFLTPTPYRGRPNASYLIPLTVRALADLTGNDLAEVCAAISANGERAFGPWQ